MPITFCRVQKEMRQRYYNILGPRRGFAAVALLFEEDNKDLIEDAIISRHTAHIGDGPAVGGKDASFRARCQIVR